MIVHKIYNVFKSYLVKVVYWNLVKAQNYKRTVPTLWSQWWQKHWCNINMCQMWFAYD